MEIINENEGLDMKINHPECDPMIIIRKWQLDFCEGNKAAAALLSFFEYWHNIKLGQLRKVKSCGLYQFHTMDELEQGVLLYSRDTINAGLKILVDKKAISIHKNPNPRYSFDRTRHFLFCPPVINAWLADTIAGNPQTEGETAIYASVEFQECIDDNTCADDMENRQTIPKTTSKITNKTTSEISKKNNHTGNGRRPIFDYTGFDELQAKSIESWFAYRQEIRKPYKTQSGMTALRNQMLKFKMSGLLIESINHSIAGEYTGVFPPSQSKGAFRKSLHEKLQRCNQLQDNGEF